MRPIRLLVLPALLAAALGCPKSVPEVTLAAPVDAGVDPLAARLDALEAEVGAVLRAQDEALWKHWTLGAPLDLSKATVGHEALFSKDTLREVRVARERLPRDAARRAAHLERWLTGQWLSRALASENDAVASLEAGLTFPVDGKDVAWRELPRLLLTEKSAVKRKALWKASLLAAERLDAALARRDAKANEVAASLDSPSTLELAAEARELELEDLARTAEATLAATDALWREVLQRQSDADVRLPLSSLTRAELPRLLRVPAAADATFPKDQVATRAISLLGALGVYGRPGLTLDLSGGAKKHPLPLTVAPSPADVRVSFRPAGGLRDQAALLSELGAALALSEARTGHVATDRLGDPAAAQALAELFGDLLGSSAWLESVGVTGAARRTVQDAWATHALFALRRAAGVVLVRLETQGLAETDARARYVQIMSRALGLPPAAEDGVRWRIDTDDFLRSATQLKAAALSRAAQEQLPADWFASKDGWRAVAVRWAQGTAEPLEARLKMAGALAGKDGGLRPGPWGAPATVAVDAGAAPADGGLGPGPWGAPAAVATGAAARSETSSSDGGTSERGPGVDAGLSPGAWGVPATVAGAATRSETADSDGGASASARGSDAGLVPGPWGAPAQVASTDAGVATKASPATAADGGLHPGPWGAPAQLDSTDAGVATKASPAPTADGGLHPGPWGAPAQVASLDASVGTKVSPATATDGGLHPGPWGAPAQVAAPDAGLRTKSPALDGGARPARASAPDGGTSRTAMLPDGGLHPRL